MGTLYLVATPIGNLQDFSPRAVETLKNAALIAVEDTRHTRSLLNHFNIHSEITSYYEHNKLHKVDYILEKLSQGDVALVSDAGTPAINDPGYELVQAALASGFDVRPVPGPSAPISALAVSGLPTDSFLYLGYLPHKSGERRKSLQPVESLPYTLIFLETPHRLLDSLNDLLTVLGDRRICAAREMTKMYEEFWRGTISGAVEYFSAKEPRGEFTLVVAGRQSGEKSLWTRDELLKAIKKETGAGKTAKEISTLLAGPSGWNKKDVYALVIELKKDE